MNTAPNPRIVLWQSFRSVPDCGSDGRCLCLFLFFESFWIVTAFDTR